MGEATCAPRRAGIVQQAMLERITSPTAVINITYQCNARCSYCRWGDGRSAERDHHEMRDVLVRAETLKELGVKRIVLSGGEPRLNPGIGRILGHYAGLVDDVIVISNGYGLGKQEARELLRAGATGITISLDSIDARESYLTRRTPLKVHDKVLGDVREIATEVEGLEFGINAVVSRVTANWGTVGALLEFGMDAGLDFVKFQPVFDDGYASRNAPELLLGRDNAGSLAEIAGRLGDGGKGFPLTNPPGFWRDVAAVCSGREIPGSACGLDGRHSISADGALGICYWVGGSTYGAASSIGRDDILSVQKRFDGMKRECKVGLHCFCTQRIDHVWT